MDDINVILADYPGLRRVRLCDCNSIHVSVGPVSICLSAEAFAQTAILIRNAMEQLTEIVEDRKLGGISLQSAGPNQSRLTH